MQVAAACAKKGNCPRRKACDALAYTLAAFDIIRSTTIVLTGSLNNVDRFFRMFNLRFRFKYYRTPVVGERLKAP